MDTMVSDLQKLKTKAEAAVLLPENTPTLTRGQTGIPSPLTPDNCPACGGLKFVRDNVPPGHPQFGKPIPCPHPVHNPERAARLAEKLIKVSGLSEDDLGRRLLDIRLSDKNRAMLEAARTMIDKPFGWLYLHGGPGSAKTEVLIAIVNELNEKGYGPVMYTKFGKIVDYIRDAFSEKRRRHLGYEVDEEGYIARLEQLKAVKVLAIDEMEKAKETEFVEMFRFDFLDDRYRQAIHGETVTIFAGNSEPAVFDAAIYDRIRDGRFKIIHNTAGSVRKSMKRQAGLVLKRSEDAMVQPVEG